MDFSVIANSVLAIASSALMYVYMRKKNEAERQKLIAETEKIRIDSDVSAKEMWRELALELRNEVSQLNKEVSQLRRENMQLQQQVQKLENVLNKA